jgi:hypothetical protein
VVYLGTGEAGEAAGSGLVGRDKMKLSISCPAAVAAVAAVSKDTACGLEIIRYFLGTHQPKNSMSTIPATRFIHTKYVSILRSAISQIEMNVYHTNSECSTYQHNSSKFQIIEYDFREGTKECQICQKLNK